MILRDETEWIELVQGGYNCLAGADPVKIQQAITEMLGKDLDFSNPLYGTGEAAKEILQILLGKNK